MNEMEQTGSGAPGGFVLGQHQHIRTVPASTSSRDLVWEDELLRMRLANRLTVQRDRLFVIIRQAVDEGAPDLVSGLKQAVSSIQQTLTAVQSTGSGVSVLSNLQPTPADLAIFYDLNYLLLAPVTQLKEHLDGLVEAISAKRGLEKEPQDLSLSVSALDSWRQRQTRLLDKLKQRFTDRSQTLAVHDAPIVGKSPALHRPFSLGQRVIYDYVEYLVLRRTTYFGSQENWFLFELAEGDKRRWLLDEGKDMPSILDECTLAVSDLGKEAVVVDGEHFTFGDRQTVDLVSAEEAGRDAAAGITYQRFRSPSGRVLYIETRRETVTTRIGRNIQPEDLQFDVSQPGAPSQTHLRQRQ